MFRRSWHFLAVFGVFVTMACSNPASAYQTVKVGPSGATVFANPQSDSATTGTLRAGQTINIGDQPRSGYYRATAAGGVTGWVQEDALILPAHPTHQANPVKASSERRSAPGGEGALATKFSVGGLAGVGIAGGGTSMAFGLDADYKLTREWGLGVYFEYLGLASASASSNGTTASSAAATASASGSIMMFAGEVNYFLPQLEGLHVGAKLGFGIASASATGSVTVGGTTTPITSISTSTTAVGGAATVGYDYPVMPILTVGGEGNFFFLSGGIASTLVNIMATVKYNF